VTGSLFEAAQLAPPRVVVIRAPNRTRQRSAEVQLETADRRRRGPHDDRIAEVVRDRSDRAACRVARATSARGRLGGTPPRSNVGGVKAAPIAARLRLRAIV
jgi:hypothetical protein